MVASAIQKTGGAAGWSKIKGFKVVAKFDQGGIDYPLEIVKLADGANIQSVPSRKLKLSKVSLMAKRCGVQIFKPKSPLYQTLRLQPI